MICIYLDLPKNEQTSILPTYDNILTLALDVSCLMYMSYAI